jgi:hypothetical protein
MNSSHITFTIPSYHYLPLLSHLFPNHLHHSFTPHFISITPSFPISTNSTPNS